MTKLSRNGYAALVFGITLPLLELCRDLCWGSWPSLLEWPIALDAYVIGALLLSGVVAEARGAAAGRALVASGWGFAFGILYRSLFEQVADPTRHAGHEWMVLTIKATLFTSALLGLIGAAVSAGAVNDRTAAG